jgi:hypothetical protein
MAEQEPINLENSAAPSHQVAPTRDEEVALVAERQRGLENTMKLIDMIVDIMNEQGRTAQMYGRKPLEAPISINVKNPMDYLFLLRHAYQKTIAVYKERHNLSDAQLNVTMVQTPEEVAAHELDHLNVLNSYRELMSTPGTLQIWWKMDANNIPSLMGARIVSDADRVKNASAFTDCVLAPTHPGLSDFALAIALANIDQLDITELLKEKGYTGAYTPPENPKATYSPKAV